MEGGGVDILLPHQHMDMFRNNRKLGQRDVRKRVHPPLTLPLLQQRDRWPTGVFQQPLGLDHDTMTDDVVRVCLGNVERHDSGTPPTTNTHYAPSSFVSLTP